MANVKQQSSLGYESFRRSAPFSHDRVWGV